MASIKLGGESIGSPRELEERLLSIDEVGPDDKKAYKERLQKISSALIESWLDPNSLDIWEGLVTLWRVIKINNLQEHIEMLVGNSLVDMGHMIRFWNQIRNATKVIYLQEFDNEYVPKEWSPYKKLDTFFSCPDEACDGSAYDHITVLAPVILSVHQWGDDQVTLKPTDAARHARNTCSDRVFEYGELRCRKCDNTWVIRHPIMLTKRRG